MINQFVVLILLIGFTQSAKHIPTLFEPTPRDWAHPIGFEGVDGAYQKVPSKSPLWSDVLSRLRTARPDLQPLKCYSLEKKIPQYQRRIWGTFDSLFKLGEMYRLKFRENMKTPNEILHEMILFAGPATDESLFILQHIWSPLHCHTKVENRAEKHKLWASCSDRIHSEQKGDDMFSQLQDTLVSSGPQKISILSFNIWNFNKPYESRIQSIADIIKKRDADIVTLQEVRLTSREYPTTETTKIRYGYQIQDLLEHLPGYQYVFVPAMTYWPDSRDRASYTQEGVAILSRYPILDSKYQYLMRNFSDREDSPHQRVVLGVVVSTPKGIRSVLTTHFSLSERARQRNIVEVHEFIQTLPGPHVLTGDLNTEAGTPELDFLIGRVELGGCVGAYFDPLEQMYKAKDPSLTKSQIRQQLEEHEWTFTTFSTIPRKRIDFFFVSQDHTKDIQCSTLDDDIKASDHKPILCYF